jgi:hypothetical protein
MKNKFTLDDLHKALLIRKHYNKMSFNDFINEYEEYFDIKIDDKTKKRFKLSGLINTDFYIFYNLKDKKLFYDTK